MAFTALNRLVAEFLEIDEDRAKKAVDHSIACENGSCPVQKLVLQAAFEGLAAQFGIDREAAEDAVSVAAQAMRRQAPAGPIDPDSEAAKLAGETARLQMEYIHSQGRGR